MTTNGVCIDRYYVMITILCLAQTVLMHFDGLLTTVPKAILTLELAGYFATHIQARGAGSLNHPLPPQDF